MAKTKPSDSPESQSEQDATASPDALTAERAAAACGVDPARVLAFRDYGDYCRVTTIDGRKLDSRDAVPSAEPGDEV